MPYASFLSAGEWPDGRGSRIGGWVSVGSVSAMGSSRPPTAARLRRLAEELEETGARLDGAAEWRAIVLEEMDYALRPPSHEGRVFSVGTIVEPTKDPSGWDRGTELVITHRPTGPTPRADARLFADGLSSWLIRSSAAGDEWVIFDRPSGSERDLVVIADVMGATLIQRHPAGAVRVVGAFGVLRWDGVRWHHEPPISSWLDSITMCPAPGDPGILGTMLEFAVHDLGSRGIGATLVYRADDGGESRFEERMSLPPPLKISRPTDLAPLRHALAQVDGAAVFDSRGVLRQLGVRLVPSPDAESTVEGYRGMRHTAGRRYSFDDPGATIVVVSEDGPVTVLRNGELLGRSALSDG
jgi:hypothetical protein